jgi:uncharacterized protein (UPF0303 family)
MHKTWFCALKHNKSKSKGVRYWRIYGGMIFLKLSSHEIHHTLAISALPDHTLAISALHDHTLAISALHDHTLAISALPGVSATL